jgi:glutamate synthase domain-containing protein 1
MASKTVNGIKSFFNVKDEKEACGVGFIVSIDGIASHKVRHFPPL